VRLGGSRVAIYEAAQLRGQVPGARGEAADGVIGLDLLRRERAVINCRTRELFLPTPGSPRLNLAPTTGALGFTRIPLTENRRGYLTVPCSIRGRRGRLVVDTGAFVTGLNKDVVAGGEKLATHREKGWSVSYPTTLLRQAFIRRRGPMDALPCNFRHRAILPAMRASRLLTPAAAAVEWVPGEDGIGARVEEGGPSPDGIAAAWRAPLLEATAIFGRGAPLEVDLGCGDGSFLVAMAELHLERDFIGLERMVGRVRSACRKIAGRGLTNARITRVDLLAGVSQLLPAASVDVFHLLFPDPWPKRRHHCRRCFTEIFLGRLLVALKSGGVLHLATDDADYFAQMQRVLATTSTLERIDELPELPVTTFEQRFRERGLPIHRVLLRKVSEVT